MSRPYRIQGENCFYHITSRGDDRKKIFISEYDYQKFLEYLCRAKEKYHFYLYAYVLMSNHYHLLLETTQPNLAKIMHDVNSAYTIYYNLKRHKSGHLFQGRYKSILVEKDNYLLELTRYIHLNPVRAKMVSTPEEYRWSSYLGYLSKTGDGYIDKQQIRAAISLNSTQYQQFVIEGIADKVKPLKNVYAGFILGDSKFIKEQLKYLKEKVANKEFSYQSDLNHIEVEDIIDTVAKKYGISMENLSKMKNRAIKEKKVLIYLMKRLSNLSNKEIGEKFGLTYSAVSKAAGSVDRQMIENSKFKKEIEELLSRFKG